MKKGWVVVATLVAAFGTAPVAVQAAPGTAGTAAEAAAPSCAAGDLCFWPHANYRGQRGRVAGDNPDWRKLPSADCPGGNWDDCASSLANRGRECTVYLYKNYNYRGEEHSLSRNDQVPDIGRWVPGFNDSISSNRWCRR
ncbi:peptidase inhibitor family I36 protein [Saccharothrix obliqua]|uniref:peptidase inhibitor family I36 protein n=1 Tax=Saccharothrix obliqua TaxID=2861747 RepID=UPI001C5D1D5A|nr:peptidase inhibitor family I36 protein [Saccharothrix obliqua]MBW4722162.1 peptidase inhibitor family I36 protein [Saccharothrix obliqua]